MLNETAPHNANSHFNDGLLEVVRILGTWMDPNPDAGFAEMVASNYQHNNQSVGDDLLEEIILRLEEIGGPDGTGLKEVLITEVDVSGAVPEELKWAINVTNKRLFYRDADDNWAVYGRKTFECGVSGGGLLDDADLDTDEDVIIIPVFTPGQMIRGIGHPEAGRRRTIYNDTETMVILVANDTDFVTNPESFRGTWLPIFLMPQDTATFIHERTWVLESLNRGSALDAFDAWGDMLAGSDPYTIRVGGTGAGATDSYLEAAEKAVGVYSITTGAGGSGNANLGAGLSGYVPENGAALFACRIAVNALWANTVTMRVFAGLHNAQAAVPNNGYWLEFFPATSGADPLSVSMGSGNGASPTLTPVPNDGGGLPKVAQSTSYIEYVIFVNEDWTRADYYSRKIGHTEQWVHLGSQTNNPSDALVKASVTMLRTAGASAAKVMIDWLGHRIDMDRHL